MGHELSEVTTNAIQAEISSVAAGAFTSRSSPGVSASGICFSPRATSSMGCSGQSSAQFNTGIPRISDLYYMSPFLPPQQLPIGSIRIGLGSTPLPSPAQNLLVIQSWTTWPQNLVMPQPQDVWGLSNSVSVDSAQNRPFSIVGHPPKRQQGAANRFHVSSALLLIFRC